MQSTRHALKSTHSALVAAGAPEPWLEAELLLCHVLEVGRTQLYAQPEALLTQRQVRSLEALLGRRKLREPLPYILGEREFYGLSFLVGPAVLVPRPETEVLVEQALAWAERARLIGTPGLIAGELASQRTPPPEPLASAGRKLVAADVGTGSGCIAVTLARHLPNATVYATDCSLGALNTARRNCERHDVLERVCTLVGHLLEPIPEPLDLIVANLPYVPEDELPHLQPEVGDYEPRLALTPGGDGTGLNLELLRVAGARLCPGGALFLEFHPLQRAVLEREAKRCFPKATVRIVQDLAGLDRVLAVEHL